MIDHFNGILALFAFAAVLLLGLVRGDGMAEVLRDGLVAIVVFLVVGKALGYIGRRLVEEEVEAEKAAEEEKKKASGQEGAEKKEERPKDENVEQKEEEPEKQVENKSA